MCGSDIRSWCHRFLNVKALLVGAFSLIAKLRGGSCTALLLTCSCRYLPSVETVDTAGGGKHRPQYHHHHSKPYRQNFADPSEPIYTDPSLFER